MRERRILYLNPQGYNNLFLYDIEFINSSGSKSIDYICNSQVNTWTNSIELKENGTIYPVFSYSESFAIFKYIHSWMKAINIVRKNKYDVIHLQWFKVPLIDIVFILLIKVLSKRPRIVFTKHNIKEHKKSVLNLQNFNRLIFSLVDEILVHDQRALRYYRLWFKIPKIRCVNHGPIVYNTDAIRPSEVSHEGYYLFIGDETQLYKGPEFVRSFCKDLSGSETLVILGKFESLANEAIVLNRYVRDEELIWLIKNAKAVYMPYQKTISQSAVAWLAVGYNANILINNIYLYRYLKEECRYPNIWTNKNEIGTTSRFHYKIQPWEANNGVYG